MGHEVGLGINFTNGHLIMNILAFKWVFASVDNIVTMVANRFSRNGDSAHTYALFGAQCCLMARNGCE